MKKQVAFSLFYASTLGLFTSLAWADSSPPACPSNEINPQILAVRASGSSACSLTPGSKNNPSFVSIPSDSNYNLEATGNILTIKKKEKSVYKVYCISSDSKPAAWARKQNKEQVIYQADCVSPANSPAV